MASLTELLIPRATFVGDSVRFLTFSGEERYIITVGPASLLTDIYRTLLVDHRAGRLAPVAWR
eukprot:2654401-Pyramimonas_sp.AAC.1